MTLDQVSKINDETFESILPYAIKISPNLPSRYKDFFIDLLNKLHFKQIRHLFTEKFGEDSQLLTMDNVDLKMFRKCFTMMNEEVRNIDRKTKI